MALTVSTNKNWSDYEATSSAPLTIGSGALTALSLTISTGKAYTAGDDIALVPTAAKIPMMLIGTVTSYDPNTGALVANCTRIESQIPSWDLVSASTNTVGTGAKTFVTYNGKSALLAASDNIMVGRRGGGGNRMIGTVTSYNNSDGTLVTNITSTIGSGTSQTDWIIVSSGTFTAWKIVPSPFTSITLVGSANLTFDMEPSYPVGSLVSLDRGQFIFNNASTTTPWVIELGTRNANSTKLFQLENNGKLDVTGAAITVKTGDGTAGQTLDLSGATYAKIDHPAIEVETGSSTGVYRPWYVMESSTTDRGYLGKNFVSRGYKNYFTPATSATVTLTTASPTVITWASHGLRPGNRVRFTTTGTFTGITAGTDYYVLVEGFTTGSFRIGVNAHTNTGVNVTAQSGTHTAYSLAEFGSGLHGNVALWNPTTRILTFGNGTQGNVIPNGAKVRIPNTHFTMEYPRTPIMSAISSATAGNAVTFVVGNVSNIPSSAGMTFFINQEEFTGTVATSTMVTATRNANGTVAANHAQGDTMYSSASTSAAAYFVRAQFDVADGGIVNLSRCSFGNVFVNLSNGQNSVINNVWVTGSNTIGTTTADVTINGICAQPHPQGDGATLTVSSILGATSVQNLYAATTAITLNQSSTAIALANLQNATVINGIEGVVTTRNGNSSNNNGASISAVIANTIIRNTTSIGGRILLQNMSRFEVDGIAHSDQSSGVVSQNVSHTGLTLANCQYAVFRNMVKASGGAAVRGTIISTDANCANVVFHSVTYDADNNSQSALNPLGNNIILANSTFGTFPDRGSTTGGVGAMGNASTGDTITLRNVVFTSGDTYGADNGNGATARCFLEQTTGHSMWWRAAGTAFDGNYQEMGPFHTLLDNNVKNTGTLCCQFSVKSSRDIYDLNGGAYLNNGGSVFLPTTGDYIVLKSYQNLRTITGFTGVVDPEDVNTGNLSYEFEMVGHEDTFTGTYTSLTTTNLNTALAAISGYTDANGFKFRLKITATSDNAANQVIQVRMFTTNNASTVLPIGYVGYTLTGLTSGSTIGAFDGLTEVSHAAPSGTSQTLQLPYAFDGNSKSNYIKVRSLGTAWDDHTVTFNQYDFARVSLQTTDSEVTQTNAATVASYTALETPAKIYDYIKYWGSLRANLLIDKLCTKGGNTLDFGSYDLVFDAAAASVFSKGGNTITLKFTTLSVGSITTTGSVTYLNGASATVPITSSAGRTGIITLTVPSGSSVVVYKSDGSRDQYVASSSGTVTSYVPAGVTGSRTYKVAKYGYLPATGSVTVTGGGYFTATATLTSDSGVTQTTVGAVAAYATLETLDKLYDFAAYNETLTGGIDYARPTTKSGAAIDLGSKDLTIDTSAGSVYSYAGAGVTIKASALADGSTFTSLTTSGAVNYLNGATFNTIITSSAGTTGKLTLSGLSSHNIYVQDGTPTQVDYQTGISSYVLWIPAGATGVWRWRAVKYGNIPESGTFSVNGGGLFSVTLDNVTDTSISQPTLSTVLAYSIIENWDKFYDYCQAYLTTSNGKTLGQFAIKNGAAVDITGYSLLIDTSASSVFNLSGSALTIKTSILNAGSNFSGLITGSVVNTANGAIIKTWYTSSAGRSVLILAPNIMPASRAWLYNQNSSTTIDNSIVSTGGVYVRTLWTSDVTIRLTVTCVDCKPIVTTGVLTNTGLTFLSTQETDDVYVANNIIGSSCDSSNGGEFTADLPNVQIDINDSNNETSLPRLYAWAKYFETTSSGIILFLNCVTASDTANYFINGNIVDISFDNKKTNLLTISGGYVSKTGGTSLVSPSTTGSIYFDSAKAYIAPSPTHGATISEIEASMVIAKEATVVSRLAASAYTAPDNSSITSVKAKTDQLVFASGRINAAIDTTLLAKTSDIVSAQTSLATLIGFIPTTPLLTSDSRLNNLDASIASRLPTSGYTTPPTTGAIVTAAEASSVLAKEATSSKIKGLVSTLL